jgi:hypothetical protein
VADRRGRLCAGAFVVVLLGSVCVMTGAAAPGCFGRECDPSDSDYGANPGEGTLDSEDVWSSNAFEGNWLDYRHKRAIHFHLGALGERRPRWINIYVSASQSPLSDDHPDFTLAGGNVAKIRYFDHNEFLIFNDSCADYFATVVVGFTPPLNPDGGVSTEDAGFPRDGSGDAVSDASGDGS